MRTRRSDDYYVALSHGPRGVIGVGAGSKHAESIQNNSGISNAITNIERVRWIVRTFYEWGLRSEEEIQETLMAHGRVPA